MKGKRIFSSMMCAVMSVYSIGTSITSVAAYEAVTKPESVFVEESNTDTNYKFDTKGVAHDGNGKVVAVKASYLDVTGNSVVGIEDAVALSRFTAEDLNIKVKSIPDINGDGVVNVIDVVFLITFLVEKQTTPTVVVDIPARYEFTETTDVTTTTTMAKVTTTTTKAATTTTKVTALTTKATTMTTKATTPTTKATTTTTKATTSTTKATTTTTKATTSTTKATTTTTKATTTTTKATTSTTKATTTTTKATTSTTKATTTTTKATTTTTKATTSTTKAATTTTITTTTVDKKAAANAVIKKAIENISITDTVSPKYNVDSEHVEHKNIYLFKIENKTYAYKIISEPTFSEEELIANPWHSSGIHFWEYNGNEIAVSKADETPNTNGKKFTYDGKEYSYKLKPYKDISFSSVSDMARIVSGVQKEYYDEVMLYDYNLSGHVDQQDLENMIIHCMSDPYYCFRDLNEDAVHMYTNMITRLQHKNAVIFITQETKPVEYSFTVNTAILGYDDGVCTEEPVQILPLSCLGEVSAKYREDDFASDENMEYIIWLPITKEWAAGSYSKDSGWTYRSGIYVMLLNDDGSLRKKWIK